MSERLAVPRITQIQKRNGLAAFLGPQDDAQTSEHLSTTMASVIYNSTDYTLTLRALNAATVAQ